MTNIPSKFSHSFDRLNIFQHPIPTFELQSRAGPFDPPSSPETGAAHPAAKTLDSILQDQTFSTACRLQAPA